jgi:hypothetical protein
VHVFWFAGVQAIVPYVQLVLACVSRSGHVDPVKLDALQIFPAPVEVLVGACTLPPSNKHPMATLIELLTVCIAEALLALSLWLAKLTNTTAAKIPIIAITTRSSTSVKPAPKYFRFGQALFSYFFIFIFSPPF